MRKHIVGSDRYLVECIGREQNIRNFVRFESIISKVKCRVRHRLGDKNVCYSNRKMNDIRTK